jgi:hypothetical protein
MISPTLPTSTTPAPTCPKRQTKVLNEELGKGLLAYALAAVGIAALSSEAMAKVVYTPTHISTQSSGMRFSIDLNHDGVPDFVIAENIRSTFTYVSVFPIQVPTGKILGTLSHGEPAAAPLRSGAYIGPAAKFSANANLMAFGTFGGFFSGPWAHARNHYLGLEFMIAGKLHFGWARVNVGFLGATLTGYAYETIPNRPIQAGLTQSDDDVTLIPPTLAPQDSTGFQTATLGLLAQGASGLAVWRRKEEDLSFLPPSQRK